jgi:membrane protease subunit HflK
VPLGLDDPDLQARVDKTIVEAPGITPYLPLPQVQKSQRTEEQR